MTEKRQTAADQSLIYQIRLRGHLDAQWADWFAGMAVAQAKGGDTLLTGVVADQAALHGLLKKVRDLGIALVSVTAVEPEAESDSGAGRDLPPSCTM